jgi:DHA2 family methylenomycin A resistance protein-like MFS transporter
VVFGVGSLGCALVGGVGTLIAARVLQGLGAALLLPGTLAIISHAFPAGPERARAIGIWAGIGGLALPAGPLLGGVLIDAFGWRAIFAVNVPIVIVSLLAAAAVVRESTDPRSRRLDARGVALGTATLLAITFAFVEGGRSGVTAPPVIAAAVAAVVLLGVFLLVERAQGESAMLPLNLFRQPAFSVANAAAGAMNLGTLGTLFVLTLFLQSVQGHPPLTAGLWLVPLFAPLAVIAPLGGGIASRIGPRLPVAAGFVVAAVGVAFLVRAQPGSGYAVLLPAFLLWGVGLGIVTPAVVAAAIGAVTDERAGLASAINNTARQAGGAIGIAVAGAVAGQPRAPGFLGGFHAVVVATGCLFLIAAALALTQIPGSLSPTKPTPP